MDPIVIAEGPYYRLRLHYAELQHFEQRITLQRQILTTALQAALTAAGLDPLQAYQLEDAHCTATPQPAPPAEAPV